MLQIEELKQELLAQQPKIESAPNFHKSRPSR